MAPNMSRVIADFANRASISMEWLLENESGRWLLPQERLDWITEDKRQIKWLQSHIWNQFKGGFSPPPPRLLGRNSVIASIDAWNTELSNKALVVDQMKWNWEQHKQSDHIFKWFREKDELSRCEIAWQWLFEKRNNLTWQHPPISNYEDLLIFFDTRQISDAEKMLIVEAIKKRVSQQQYRKKMADKKQCNLVLSNKTILDLDKLAAKYGVSRPQIMETLIQFETERNIYLPEKVKAISWG